MNTCSIGGTLGMRELAQLSGSYHERATLHRPSDPDTLAAEVRRLLMSGLKRRDIAQALGIDLAQVIVITGDICPLKAPR